MIPLLKKRSHKVEVQDRHYQGLRRLVALKLLIPGGENCGSINVSTDDDIIDFHVSHSSDHIRTQVLDSTDTSKVVEDAKYSRASRLTRVSNTQSCVKSAEKDINIVHHTLYTFPPTVMASSRLKHLLLLRAKNKCQTAHERGCLVDDHLV